MRNRTLSVAVFFFAFGYAGLTAPFRGADEPSHFFRAWQIAEGHWLAQRGPGGVVGGKLPVSLLTLATAAGEFPDVPKLQTSAAEMKAGWQVDLQPRRRALVNFPGSALYAPGIYLPQAFGIKLVRLFSNRPLLIFYAARFCGAFCGAALLVLALRRLPAAAQGLGVVAFIPMALFQIGVISADTLTIPLAFLWSAELLRTRATRAIFSKRERWRFFILALALSQVRSPLLALGIFAVPFVRFPSRKAAIGFYSAFLVLAFLPYLAWNARVVGLLSQMRPGIVTDPALQSALFLRAPQHFLSAAAGDIHDLGPQHLHEMLGVFGWLNFPLPWALLALVVASLVAGLGLVRPEAIRLAPSLRCLCLSLALLGFVAAEFAIYAMWNEVGSDHLQGLQGRYFLPFLPFLFIALAQDWLRRIPRLIEIAYALLILANLGAILLLARATFA